MHIKKLEIVGFKSFVDRTVINFDHDVTGIVGPNGCGKSNIVDAIRWCMGEQSPRQLRGKSMDDVIFSGSESRKSHGYAEVTLTFTNDDPEYAQTLPIEYRDYAEIAVTRKLFRDGTSEYLINKTQVRLKDITDLFLGTGVGSKAYSIIEQGKIGLIVSAKPEDRRLLIEEAAGITKYKHRKRQAEKKMDLTRQNLLRVGDIVAEIERNLHSLKRQAAKAKRYLEYRHEHDDLILHEASHRLLAIIALSKVQQQQVDTIGEQTARCRDTLATRTAQLDAARAECVQLEQRVDKDQNDAFLADNEVRAVEALSQRALDRQESLRERQLVATQEATRIGLEKERFSSDLAKVQSALEHLVQSETLYEQRWHNEQQRLSEREANQRQVEQRTAQLASQLSTASAEIATAKERIAGFERRTIEMRSRSEKLTIDRENFAEDLREAQSTHEQLNARLVSLQQEQAASKERVAVLIARQQRQRERLASEEIALAACKTELSQVQGKLRGLQEVHASLAGVGSGTRALMESKDPCIVGILADLLEPQPQFIAPFAALMAERLQTVVVNDLERAMELLQDLSQLKKGRASVLCEHAPGHELRQNQSENEPSAWQATRTDALADTALRNAIGQPGVVGLVPQMLRFDPRFEGLVHRLVGRALLVEDDATAKKLRSGGVTNDLVTTAGVVFHADGRISAGTADDAASQLLERKAQIRVLEEQLTQVQARLDQHQGDHQQHHDSVQQTVEELEEARTAETNMQVACAEAMAELRREADQIGLLQRRVDEIAREIDEVQDSIERASDERSEAEALLAQTENLTRDATHQQQQAQSELEQLAEQVAQQRAVCTEHQVAFATIREQTNGQRANEKRLRESVTELQHREEQLAKEQAASTEEQHKIAQDLVNYTKRIEVASAAAKEAHAQFDLRKQSLDNARNALAIHEGEIKGLRDELDRNAKVLNDHEMALQRLQLERGHLLEGIAERFRGLSLPSVVGDYHLRPAPDENHRRRIEELAILIDRMGPVNLDAMQEYETTNERYVFYTTQKEDLDKALLDLERAITQMNRQTRRLFRETFDSVNERFQKVFPTMFRGGKASLELTNPDDLLESGIEIKAQPPGKKVGSLELLSGGEKALTAVSLVFAIFQHKPSPFCVLDEVDAPLDEANVARFNELVRSMTDRSQFILITHIKRTMQSVDVLYGVTMQEPGVSRLVSVKVNTSAQPRWTGATGQVA